MSGGGSVPGAGWWWRGLTGIQTGVLGGLAMLGWFLLASALLRQPVWTVPSLLGALLGQDPTLRRGFSQGSLTGAALVVFLAGVVGGLFALATSGIRSRRRMMLLGILAGLLGFYFSNALVFRKLGAVAWAYSSPRSLLVAHLLFGVVLGCHPPAPEGGGPAAGEPSRQC